MYVCIIVHKFSLSRKQRFSVTRIFFEADFNHWQAARTYLLTYSMEQGPSWEASWFAAGQEIPRVLRNPKVPHRTHKRPPPVPILSLPNPVLIP